MNENSQPSASRAAVIALGSNLGDTGATLQAAVRDLGATAGITVERMSRIHETVAVSLDGPDPSRPRFANAVALISTTLEPLPLLHALQAIEQRHHRRRDVRWGDRTLDLDIVDIPGVRLQTAELTVPHVRAAERDFVLAPWAEIDPTATLSGTPIVELLARVRSEGQES
ncbi:2-amino-4-hydroxy-6-hydroxymethyldihydropteridine diphosphokinase [Pseudoclavibacter sp. CFCC 11306]|uniref:2-amino-4-hydroxy-6- hydroxymethyldihydropteridine diphosphokinase n=1 Tax=Pseudoclavibacter sp. CFCC 11306 TaxID=1564493 RepID=UPI001300D6E6|nr:2-amino-4-hydroxy-6-hydroxymethyldihydropteridine diphosphokinase [Pseudoclavibacter sp. CFCC 11306]KAB1659039.1 2-amino-4-hydroxy-6-hydroxymethyldihydropteridine diphosphokinase [Pseudoclavibacter sp. CFCC 11306]